jgi:hypothetical protein
VLSGGGGGGGGGAAGATSATSGPLRCGSRVASKAQGTPLQTVLLPVAGQGYSPGSQGGAMTSVRVALAFRAGWAVLHMTNGIWMTVPIGCEVSMVQGASPRLLNSACGQCKWQCGWQTSLVVWRLHSTLHVRHTQYAGFKSANHPTLRPT